jgi:hypothetical protein
VLLEREFVALLLIVEALLPPVGKVVVHLFFVIVPAAPLLLFGLLVFVFLELQAFRSGVGDTLLSGPLRGFLVMGVLALRGLAVLFLAGCRGLLLEEVACFRRAWPGCRVRHRRRVLSLAAALGSVCSCAGSACAACATCGAACHGTGLALLRHSSGFCLAGGVAGRWS